MKSVVRVAFVTVPSAEVARKLATLLVEERLAACVNIVPGVESVYRWEGKVATDAELLLVAKTKVGLEEAFVRAVEASHPYGCPEVIFVDVPAGRAKYVEWVVSETR